MSERFRRAVRAGVWNRLRRAPAFRALEEMEPPRNLRAYTPEQLAAAAEAIRRLVGERKAWATEISDTYAAAVLDAYHRAYEDLVREFTELWDRTFGRGVTPTQTEVYRLIASSELADVIERRLRELEGELIGPPEPRAGTGGGLLQAAISDAIRAGHVGAMRELAAMIRPDYMTRFTAINPALSEIMAAQVMADTRNITAATRAAIMQELRQGLLLGEGIDKMRDRLAVIDSIGKTRGELVARWSVIKAQNLAALEQYKRAQEFMPDLRKVWRAELDDKTCDMCAMLHGEVVGLDDQFSHDAAFGGKPLRVYQGILDVPPRHPRCRCTVQPWSELWSGVSSYSPDAMRADARAWARERGFDAGEEAEEGVTRLRRAIQKISLTLT